MFTTTIVCRLNDKFFIGDNTNGLKEIESFKPLFIREKNAFKNNIIYIVMISTENLQEPAEIYELDTIPLETLDKNSNLEDLSDEDLISLSNRLLKLYAKNRKIH